MNPSYVLVAGAPFLLGLIADRFTLPTSFKVALSLAVAAVLLLLLIPARPERLVASGGPAGAGGRGRPKRSEAQPDACPG